MGIFEEEMERIGKKSPIKLTFVCSGNICRSAYADFAFREMVDDSEILKDKIVVDSGGLIFKNEKIDPRTAKVLIEDNSKFSEEEINKHIPRYIKEYLDMFDETDIIIGMTKTHKSNTPKQYRKGPQKKFRMLKELTQDERIDIGDPYWAEIYEDYKEILMDVKENLKILKEKLEKHFSM